MSGLLEFHINCVESFFALDYIECYFVTLFDFVDQSRHVYEDLLTILAADETKPFGFIEEFNCTLFHNKIKN